MNEKEFYTSLNKESAEMMDSILYKYLKDITCECEIENIEKILDLRKEFSLKEHVDKLITVLEDLYEGEPLLKIILDDINSVPEVYYKGEKIDKKVRVSFDWKTRDEIEIECKSPYIYVEQLDINEEKDYLGTKVIQHNHLIKEGKQRLRDYKTTELLDELGKRDGVDIDVLKLDGVPYKKYVSVDM